FAQRRPGVAVTHVGLDARTHVVVDHAHELAGDAVVGERGEHLARELLGARGCGARLEGAVEGESGECHAPKLGAAMRAGEGVARPLALAMVRFRLDGTCETAPSGRNRTRRGQV